jgi:hypothetical protein
MAQQDSGTTGIGDDDINEDGIADAMPDMAETGGSGGAGLTRNEGDGAPAPSDKPRHPPTESGARGAEDTREEQAGADSATGLGSAETGANQTEDDLAPDT